MRQVVLLRGINLGARNRVAMPALREALTEAGYGNVRTYVASGNVVLDTDQPPAELAGSIGALLAERFVAVPVVTRTDHELADVVARNPLGELATDPKRYQVSFLSEPLAAEVAAQLEALAAPAERLVVDGRELFAWHPEGVARSKLWNAVAGKLGVTATARNWTTVTKLLEMARDGG